MDGIHEDTGDCSMQCTEHPFKNNTPAGGICAICLQEKLGKLVSSSFPITIFPTSSSSSPSFRSDINTTTTTTTNTTNLVASAAAPPVLTNTTSQLTQTNCHHHHQHYSNRSRILYLIGQRKNKKKDQNIIIDRVHECINNNNSNSNSNSKLVFKRSKSTADGLRDTHVENNENPHHKRGFWSFIHLQKHSHATLLSKKAIKNISSASTSCHEKINEVTVVVEDNEAPCQASFDRKVSRSRSVGCGSRSFSGDFFERISTGFGDCTLRRVESQRQQKSQVSVINNSQDSIIKERVRCGGLFSGFMVTSSSSSSSSSSYWVASNHPRENTSSNSTGKVTSAVAGRERGWGWALASPIRAFSKQGSNKREGGSNKNQAPNINAIPSLLSVRS